MAQLVARTAGGREAVGSNPATPTIRSLLASTMVQSTLRPIPKTNP